ncbi:MAG: hypothetical protein AMXMBFR59_35830 [Rhodanobacteraceae bacterium]
MNDRIDAAFHAEWLAAATARSAGDHATAMRHLERAHILGQRRTALHVRSHVGMLALAWQRRDRREIIGQLARIAAAALFSRLWVPTGNTGGTDVSAFRRMPVPEDLREVLTRTREP